MSVERIGIRSRTAVFAGSALGGGYWGLLLLPVLAHQTSSVTIAPGDLLIVIATSLWLVLGGWGLLLNRRSTARTAGCALIICALSGWIVLVPIAIQMALPW